MNTMYTLVQQAMPHLILAPVALPLLVSLFAEHSALPQLQAFVSDNACRIYGITPPQKKVVLDQQSWRVPDRYGDVVPFYAGRELAWQVRTD